MNLRYKYIHVAQDTTRELWADKPVWYIFNNKSNEAIGRILWYSPWRRWVATFAETTVLSADCLADIQDAIGKLARAAQGQEGDGPAGAP